MVCRKCGNVRRLAICASCKTTLAADDVAPLVDGVAASLVDGKDRVGPAVVEKVVSIVLVSPTLPFNGDGVMCRDVGYVVCDDVEQQLIIIKSLWPQVKNVKNTCKEQFLSYWSVGYVRREADRSWRIGEIGFPDETQ